MILLKVHLQAGLKRKVGIHAHGSESPLLCPKPEKQHSAMLFDRMCFGGTCYKRSVQIGHPRSS